MNRETKRMLQRQGQLEADGTPSTKRTAPVQKTRQNSTARPPIHQRVAQFFREVRTEMRQVAWPTRPEVRRSAMVVFFTLVLLIAAIFGMDQGFSHAFLWLLGS